MTWVKFREAFEREFLKAYILYIRAQKYLNLRQYHMIVKKFFTWLNPLTWYTLRVANTNKWEIEIFINSPQADITKDVLTRENPSMTYTQVIVKA